jgi:hypothetical protein
MAGRHAQAPTTYRRSRGPVLKAKPGEGSLRPCDVAHAILVRPSRECTGNLFGDEDVLAEEGVTDLDSYRAASGDGELTTDLFLD